MTTMLMDKCSNPGQSVHSSPRCMSLGLLELSKAYFYERHVKISCYLHITMIYKSSYVQLLYYPRYSNWTSAASVIFGNNGGRRCSPRTSCTARRSRSSRRSAPSSGSRRVLSRVPHAGAARGWTPARDVRGAAAGEEMACAWERMQLLENDRN